MKHFMKYFSAVVFCICLLAGSFTAFAQEKDQVFSDLSVISVNGRQLRLADWETMSFEEILTQLETNGFVITKVYVYEENFKRVERENGLTHDVIMNLYNSYDFTKNSYITMLFASDPVVEHRKTLHGTLEFGTVSGIVAKCYFGSDAKFGAVGASGEKMRDGDFSELTAAYPLVAGGLFQYSNTTRDYSYCVGQDPHRAIGINNNGVRSYEFCTNLWKPDHTTPKEEMKPEAHDAELLGALSTITYHGQMIKLSEFSDKTWPEILDLFAGLGFSFYHNGTDLMTVQQAKDLYDGSAFNSEAFRSCPMGQNGDDEVELWLSKDQNEILIRIRDYKFENPTITFTAAGIPATELRDQRATRLIAEYPQLKAIIYNDVNYDGFYTYKDGDSELEIRITPGDYACTMYSFTTKYKN